MPSISTHRRRHGKTSPSAKKSQIPPALSLNSRYSTSRSTSDEEATPRSIFPASLRPSKRSSARESRVKEDIEDNRKSKASDDTDQDGLHVDVFAFMEREDDDKELEAKDIPRRDQLASALQIADRSPNRADAGGRSPRENVPELKQTPKYSDLEVRHIQEEVHHAWARASIHSDSGISMQSSNSDRETSPIMQHKYAMLQDELSGPIEPHSILADDTEPLVPAVQDLPDLVSSSGSSSLSPPVSRSRMSFPQHQPWPYRTDSSGNQSIPEAYLAPRHSRQVSSLSADVRVDQPPEMPAPHSWKAGRHTKKSSTASPPSVEHTGYDYLASQIGASPSAVLKPIYRKFETLNNRMLLYLQDEISEIEEQLRDLDAAIAQQEAEEGKSAAPSRRQEAKFPSRLHWHRQDLLSRGCAKVEQYNKALTSYAMLLHTLPASSRTDISAYKAWISEHTPIDPSETAYLEKSADLLTVSPANPASSHHRHTSSTASMIASGRSKHPLSRMESPLVINLALAFVAIVIIFKVVPFVFARLVISAMAGLAALFVLASHNSTGDDETTFWGLGEITRWKRGVSIYGVVIIVLAFVVD